MFTWAKALAGIVQLLNVVADYFRMEQLKQAGRNEQRLATSEKTNEILGKQLDAENTKRDSPTELLNGMRESKL